jgi:hypothetical protein
MRWALDNQHTLKAELQHALSSARRAALTRLATCGNQGGTCWQPARVFAHSPSARAVAGRWLLPRPAAISRVVSYPNKSTRAASGSNNGSRLLWKRAGGYNDPTPNESRVPFFMLVTLLQLIAWYTLLPACGRILRMLRSDDELWS